MKNTRQQLTALACSPNGFLIVSGSAAGLIEVSTSEGVPLYKYQGHEGLICSVAFASSGRMVASASADTTVQVWDAITGKRSVIYTGHSEPVKAASWSPDGTCIASCGQQEVQVWTASSGVLKWHRHGDAVFSAVAWSPDGRYVAATDLRGVVTLWNSEGRKVDEYAFGCRLACGIAWSPCGQFLAIGSDGSNAASALAVVDDRLVGFASYGGPVGKTCGIAWSPDGRCIALAGYESLYVWPIGEQWNTRSLDGIRHTCMIGGLAWTPYGVAFGDECGCVFTWAPGSHAAGLDRERLQGLLFAMQKAASGEIQVHLIGQPSTWSISCEEVALRWLSVNKAVLLEASSRTQGDAVSGTYRVPSGLLTFPA